MNLGDVGEFSLIERIQRLFPLPSRTGLLGIGDDCAVLPYTQGKSLLITTDLLVENVHFLKAQQRPEDVGYKALAVNLSDIAAMGAKPLYAFLSLSLPADTELAWVDNFLKGFQELAAQHHVLLLGGDTTGSEALATVSVTVMGEASTETIKYRSTAQPGDLVCVTGFLGDSWGGLQVLLKKLPADQFSTLLLQRHFHPRPHIEEGQWLALQKTVHAMMDVSDGLNSDLLRLHERSRCGFDIHLDKLPVSPELKQLCGQLNWEPEQAAAVGGEDYCLLFTLGAETAPEVFHRYESEFHRPLFPIGTVTPATNGIRFLKQGVDVKLQLPSFRHF